MTAILGISAYYHDSAAALLIDGEIAAAASGQRRLVMLAGDSHSGETCRTFILKGESHTLGNALKNVLLQNPNASIGNGAVRFVLEDTDRQWSFTANPASDVFEIE